MWRQAVLWLVVLSVVLGGCGRSNGQEMPLANDSAAPPTIALVMKTLTNPFFVEMEKGARRAEQEFGITLIVKTAAQETSIEQQIEIVEELIHEQVDAIIIAPGDSIELIPVLKKAQEADIVVINIDNRLDPSYLDSIGLRHVPFISVDNEQGAYLSAKYISDQVTEPTEALIIEGIRNAQNAIDRKAGAERAFAENELVTLVDSATANWKIDEGYRVAEELFVRHPRAGLLFCANDMMALGALRYLEEVGRDDVLVAGYDALSEVRQVLQDGRLAVTIDQQAAEQGYLGVQYAIRALNGETLPSETLIDVLVVTQATLQE